MQKISVCSSHKNSWGRGLVGVATLWCPYMSCTCTHTCTHMHSHMHSHMQTHMHSHMQTHMQTHMHTHTCTDAANAFQVSHADKSFHVVASSAADKNNWLSNLLKYIKKTSPQGITTPLSVHNFIVTPLSVHSPLAMPLSVCLLSLQIQL